MTRRKKNPKFPDFYRAKGSVFSAHYAGTNLVSALNMGGALFSRQMPGYTWG